MSWCTRVCPSSLPGTEELLELLLVTIELLRYRWRLSNILLTVGLLKITCLVRTVHSYLTVADRIDQLERSCLTKTNFNDRAVALTVRE